jgi:hypothetical protein
LENPIGTAISCYFHVLCRSLAIEGSSQHCGGLQYRENLDQIVGLSLLVRNGVQSS